jgi:citrate lyase subunit gamma (acyl carrier protein)
LNNVLKTAQAGTLESNDIMIIIEPGENGITLDLQSIVKKQFGAAITRTIVDAVKARGITDINIKAIDKGALDYTILARLTTALSRAGVESTGGVS